MQAPKLARQMGKAASAMTRLFHALQSGHQTFWIDDLIDRQE